MALLVVVLLLLIIFMEMMTIIVLHMVIKFSFDGHSWGIDNKQKAFISDSSQMSSQTFACVCVMAFL